MSIPHWGGTYASLDGLKERPAFSHHLNRQALFFSPNSPERPTKPTSFHRRSFLFISASNCLNSALKSSLVTAVLCFVPSLLLSISHHTPLPYSPAAFPFSAYSLTLVRHTTHPLLKSLSACQVNVCPAGVDTHTHTQSRRNRNALHNLTACFWGLAFLPADPFHPLFSLFASLRALI